MSNLHYAKSKMKVLMKVIGPKAGKSFWELAQGGLISTDFPNTTP
jgi:hypothetical protein